MQKSILFLAGFAILFAGCGDKELRELSKRRHAELKGELRSLKTSLESEVQAVKNAVNDLKMATPALEKMEFLTAKLKGVKARIVTNQGDIELAFFPEKAPIHCFNFITRAESGFYDNTKFHRVIPGFMIQGGDPNSKDENPFDDGGGSPIVAIPHEFNDTPHHRGVLSMARPGAESLGAGSQFFIMHGEALHLDGKYSAFGKVTKGLEVVDKIATSPTNKKDSRLKDRPLKLAIIKTIKVYR